jgi:hypothetical protein
MGTENVAGRTAMTGAKKAGSVKNVVETIGARANGWWRWWLERERVRCKDRQVVLGGESCWDKGGNRLVKKIAGDGSRGQIVCVVAESSDKARTVVLVGGEDDKARTVVLVGGEDRKSQNPDSSVGNE